MYIEYLTPQEESELRKLQAKKKRVERMKKADEKFMAQVDERKDEILERWGISKGVVGDYPLP